MALTTDQKVEVLRSAISSLISAQIAAFAALTPLVLAAMHTLSAEKAKEINDKHDELLRHTGSALDALRSLDL